MAENNREGYYGKMKVIPELSESDRARFFNKIRRTDGCWEWTSSTNIKNGYGAFKVHSKDYGAHRISYTIHHGIIPYGFVVMHICDNKKCVNPSHLKLGTQRDNYIDATIKGRRIPKGQPMKHPSYAAYRIRGCRCVECVAIYREFERSRKIRYSARKKEQHLDC
jgi:hypothetical protein